MRMYIVGACAIGACLAVGAGVPLAQPGNAAPAAGAQPQDAEAQRRTLSYGVGYYLGAEVREGLAADGLRADTDLMIKGFSDGLRDAAPMMPREELDGVLFAVHEEMERRAADRMLREDPAFRELAEANLRKARLFLEENGRDPGVVTLPSGAQYKVLRAGDGPKPGPEDTVVVIYRAMRADGLQYSSGEGAEIGVDAIRAGAAEILQLMPVGSRWKAVFPPERAYGVVGVPPLVGPNEAIVVDVELVAIKN